jgi:tRNA threonylcarbamoyladenosine modification (KEOPS) complex  Pcc1 subunit
LRKALVSIGTEESETLEASLRPEASRPLPRTRLAMSAGEGELRLEILARDTSALRAALNSYLRWASAALKVIEEAKG